MKGIVEKALKINEDARMTQDEMMWLNDWINKNYKGGNSLEIGAYKGMLSYLCSAYVNERGKQGKKHFIVDAFDIVIDEDESNTHRYETHTVEMMEENLGEYLGSARIIKSKSLDWEAAHILIDERFDYVFIDGDHRDPIVYLELCLIHGSADKIIGHDYGWPGVTASVDRFCERFGYEVNQPLNSRGIFELIKK